jgi:alkylated DNA repair protein alkB family protein 1
LCFHVNNLSLKKRMSDDEEQPYAAAAPHHDLPGECQTHGKRCSGIDLSQTAFRIAEKRYKLVRYDRREAKRKPAAEADLADVVDMRSFQANSERNQRLLRPVVVAGAASPPTAAETTTTATTADSGSTTMKVGSSLSSSVATQLWAFDGVPGLFLLPNALSEAEQHELCRAALDEYSQSAKHPNNISTLDASQETSGYRPGLRWATLGYSYNWTEKKYHRQQFSSFPSMVADLSTAMVARITGLGSPFSPPKAYEPQTAIVNYFPVGSMMMAHQDVSEVCLEQALVSISLGCSAVFLMGTESRQDPPFAFRLRSGDVAVFTGPSRTAFHAVPRIFDDLPSHFEGPAADGGLLRLLQGGADANHDGQEAESSDRADTSTSLGQRMRGLRININVRQVFDDGAPCGFLGAA